MQVIVEIEYEDKDLNRQEEVTVGSTLQGSKLLNAIDKAVEKKFKDDNAWTGWHLIDIKRE